MKKSPEDLLIEQKSINKEITQMQKLQTNSGNKAAYFCKELNYLYPTQGTTGSVLFSPHFGMEKPLPPCMIKS